MWYNKSNYDIFVDVADKEIIGQHTISKSTSEIYQFLHTKNVTSFFKQAFAHATDEFVSYVCSYNRFQSHNSAPYFYLQPDTALDDQQLYLR